MIDVAIALGAMLGFILIVAFVVYKFSIYISGQVTKNPWDM